MTTGGIGAGTERDPADPQDVYAGGNFAVVTDHGDLDVFAIEQIAGAPDSYEALRARAVEAEIFGMTVYVAHPDHLIRMKDAAARSPGREERKRAQDLDDIAVLAGLEPTS